MTSLLAFCFFIIGCPFENTENDTYQHRLWASVESIFIQSKSHGEIKFHIFATVGDPCHLYDTADIEQKNTDIYIKLFSKRQKDLICPTVIDTIMVDLTVAVTANNTYDFHFWQLDNTYIDSTIFIP